MTIKARLLVLKLETLLEKPDKIPVFFLVVFDLFVFGIILPFCF